MCHPRHERKLIGMNTRRTANTDACLEETLAHIREEDLPQDVREFHETCLPKVEYSRLLRAAKVGKNLKTYQDISRGIRIPDERDELVDLSPEEKEALCDEQDSVFSERGMLIVIFTVSLAALLQGHVQSSLNGSALYYDRLNLCPNGQLKDCLWDTDIRQIVRPRPPQWFDWALGATSAAPFLASAAIGCWLALPISDRYGRKGSMVVATVLVLLTSLLSGLLPVMTRTHRWQILLGIRIVNGIGMGIKAVNTPILASETAIGYWRGTSILAWQLWVAFGIFIGFVFNTIFSLPRERDFALALILGAPIIASIMLLIALLICPESPRWHMRRGPNYSPEKSYAILKSLRKCELIAMRDVYLLHKSIQQEHRSTHGIQDFAEYLRYMRRDSYDSFRDFLSQYLQLFHEMRLRNALISSSIVALAQQLCGINILALFSGMLFTRILLSNEGDQTLHSVTRVGMYYSMGFGAVNFIFGMPAFRTIDKVGRRKWLVATLLPMTILMALAALSFLPSAYSMGSVHTTAALVAVFLYLHAALYSPGLGPVPFILAAESFPLSNREVGCAFAISVNLFFAGVLSICFPGISSALSTPGALGLFSGFNLVAFILIFLFVEETRLVSLEDLDFVYAVPKSQFMRFQAFVYLPWFFKTYIPYLAHRYVLRGKIQSADPEGLKSGSERASPERPQLYNKNDPSIPAHDKSTEQIRLDPNDACA